MHPYFSFELPNVSTKGTKLSAQYFNIFDQIKGGKIIYCSILVLVQFLFTLILYKRTKKNKHEVIQNDR